MFIKRIDGLFLTALCMIAFMAFNVWQDQHTLRSAQAATLHNPESSPDQIPPIFTANFEPDESGPATLQAAPANGEPTSSADPRAFASPYEKFSLTQGIHGMDYGHLAVDIAAGKGAAIKAPINGVITAFYTDEWGNSTLVVENEVYQVTFLHGLYTVSQGDIVEIGDLLGTESNQGYTLDAYGRSCRNRDCGYHTHLNVYDKTLGENVNPLNLIGLDQEQP